MMQHAVLALKPFGAFHAVELAEPRVVLCWPCGLVLGQMGCGTEVGMNLVKVSVISLVNNQWEVIPWRIQNLVRRFVFILLRAPIVISVRARQLACCPSGNFAPQIGAAIASSCR